MAKKVFIIATGTDIGKTYVSALIVKEMRKQNFNCGYFKPVLSGVEIIDLEVTEAGTYTAPEGKAYGKVIVTIESDEAVE